MHERLVVGAAAEFLAFQHPRPDSWAFVALQVAVVMQAPRDPQPERPVLPPGLDRQRIGGKPGQFAAGQVVRAGAAGVSLRTS
jgi:hypothetical protein